MVYKAIKEVGGYKPGDVVPDDKAKVWNKMYGVLHCEYTDDMGLDTPIEKVEEQSVVEEVVQPLDLNNDGQVDKEDAKIASKVMNDARTKKVIGRRK